MSSVPTPPSLDALLPKDVLNRVMEVGCLENVLALRDDWASACAEAIEVLPASLQASRAESDHRDFVRMIAIFVEGEMPSQNRDLHFRDYENEIVVWGRFTTFAADVPRACKRPRSACFVNGRAVSRGVLYCKSASCDRCGHLKAANYLLQVLDAAHTRDTLIVAFEALKDRGKYRRSLMKWSKENDVPVGGFAVPTVDGVLIVHDALDRKSWGARKDESMSIDRVMDLLMQYCDLKIAHRRVGNFGLFGTWKARKVTDSSLYKTQQKPDVFVWRRSVSEQEFDSLAEDCGLLCTGDNFVGDPLKIARLMELVDAEPLASMQARRHPGSVNVPKFSRDVFESLASIKEVELRRRCAHCGEPHGRPRAKFCGPECSELSGLMIRQQPA